MPNHEWVILTWNSETRSFSAEPFLWDKPHQPPAHAWIPQSISGPVALAWAVNGQPMKVEDKAGNWGFWDHQDILVAYTTQQIRMIARKES